MPSMARRHIHWVKVNKIMETQISPLVDGTYSVAQAIFLVTELYDVKIRFHEKMITENLMEEDIEMRELKIKKLQNDRASLIAFMRSQNVPVRVMSLIQLSLS
jgi:hypothetical protein